ncbi:MAG: hypothetical protein ACRDH5_03275, partial [bacterium]
PRNTAHGGPRNTAHGDPHNDAHGDPRNDAHDDPRNDARNNDPDQPVIVTILALHYAKRLVVRSGRNPEGRTLEGIAISGVSGHLAPAADRPRV